MNKYIAIGHFEDSENITSVASSANTIKGFRHDCRANSFIPWVILSEKKMEILKNTDSINLYDEVRKLTTNFHIWSDICDYIEQCFDIMEDKLMKA